VAKGQLLATLESKDLAAAVADAKGSYDQAAAAYRNTSSSTVPNELVKAQSDLQSAQRQLEAAKKVLEQPRAALPRGRSGAAPGDEAAVAHTQGQERVRDGPESRRDAPGRGAARGSEGRRRRHGFVQGQI